MWYGEADFNYSASDVLPFILLANLMGLLAPLHTMLCLRVLELRKRLHARLWQPFSKVADAAQGRHWHRWP